MHFLDFSNRTLWNFSLSVKTQFFWSLLLPLRPGAQHQWLASQRWCGSSRNIRESSVGLRCYYVHLSQNDHLKRNGLQHKMATTVPIRQSAAIASTALQSTRPSWPRGPPALQRWCTPPWRREEHCSAMRPSTSRADLMVRTRAPTAASRHTECTEQRNQMKIKSRIIPPRCITARTCVRPMINLIPMNNSMLYHAPTGVKALSKQNKVMIWYNNVQVLAQE